MENQSVNPLDLLTASLSCLPDEVMTTAGKLATGCLAIDSQDIAAAIEYISPSKLAPETSQFNGPADVTGVFSYVADGEIVAAFATSSARPFSLYAEYIRVI